MTRPRVGRHSKLKGWDPTTRRTSLLACRAGSGGKPTRPNAPVSAFRSLPDAPNGSVPPL
ncbi:hypothetical protein BC628DRAFT_196678 [Trametes gibbosa]|nr:hypothetical protein BC628DRAFT_196678 [Trametes gibbosa]